jgi:hypothetical protein
VSAADMLERTYRKKELFVLTLRWRGRDRGGRINKDKRG